MELIIDIISEFAELAAEVLFMRSVKACSDRSTHPVKRLLAAVFLLLTTAALAGVFVRVGITVSERSAVGGAALILTGAAAFTAMAIYIARKIIRSGRKDKNDGRFFTGTHQ